MADVDVLASDAGPEGAGRRGPRGLLAALAVVALLLVVGDRVVQEREVEALLHGVQAGQQASVYADRRLAGTVQYASGSLTSASVSPAVRADLRRLVQREAAGQLPPVQAARDDVARVRPLPWHGSVRAARDAALAHLDARLAHLRAVALDLRALYAPRPAVTSSAERARIAVGAVVPRDRAALLYR